MVQYPGNITRAALAALISCVLASPAGAQEAAIKIVVQEGQGAINNIPQRRAKEPVVQVQHEDGEPVVGATVTFLLPDTGPGGTFADGARMLNMQTDAKGQAVGRGLKPNATAGRFLIRVNVSYHGQTASTTIAQINAIPAGATKGGSGKKFLIIALIGGAAAGGLAAALGGKSGSNNSGVSSPVTNTPGTVLSPGSPTIQPPH
jgi:hypothetical protein